MFPPRVGGFEPPYIQLLLSYFIFLEGGGSIHGVQHWGIENNQHW